MDMQSAIMVKLPEAFGAKEARKLGRELKSRIQTGASGVVVDLSRVRQMDLAGLQGLLDCMETIAANDGALQLGQISTEAATILELTRMDRLFQKFPGFDVSSAVGAEQQEETVETTETADTADVARNIVQPQPVAA